MGAGVAGPYNATAGNVGQMAEGLLKGEDLGEAVEGARVSRDVVQLARTDTPGGNIWFVRAAYNRVVLDNQQRMLDPEAQEDFA